MIKNSCKKIKILKTDLACELIDGEKTNLGESIDYCKVVIDKQTAKRIGKDEGIYLTYSSPIVKQFRAHEYKRLTLALKEGFDRMLKGDKILCVGLGNSDLEADAFGVRVCENIRLVNDKIGIITPSVYGKTGIESACVVQGVCEKFKPDCVVIFDSLCAGSLSRLYSSFQFSSAGITPGSGVENSRKKLDQLSLGAPVISVGVPTVVYASTIALEHDGERIDDDLVVTGKDSEFWINDLAQVVSGAFNLSVQSR